MRPYIKSIYGLSEADTATHMGHVQVLQAFQFGDVSHHVAARTIQEMIVHLTSVATPENAGVLSLMTDGWLGCFALNYGHANRIAGNPPRAAASRPQPTRKPASAQKPQAEAKPVATDNSHAILDEPASRPTQQAAVDPELAAARAALARPGKRRGPAVAHKI